MMSVSLSDRLQSASEETIHSEDLSRGRDCDERETDGLSHCNRDEGNRTRPSDTLNSRSLSGAIDSCQIEQASSSNSRHDQTAVVGFRQNQSPTENTDAHDVFDINSEARENPCLGENLLDCSRVNNYCRIDVDRRSENRKKTESGSLLVDPATKTEASAGSGVESEKKEGASASVEGDSRRTVFNQGAIESETTEILRRTLCDERYEPNTCKVKCHQLAGKILRRIIRLCPKRYKLVIFVSIGSLCDRPGIQFGSRCLWDADTDVLATVRYANDTLFAVAMVYALCTD